MAKETKAQANYREGSPVRSCGLCSYFQSKQHACDVVAGDISPFGFSNRYKRQDNPFRKGTQADFTGVKVAAVNGMPVAVTRASRMRIGGKSY